MENKEQRKLLACESLAIIKDLISENDLVKGIYIAEARLNIEEDTIIIRDVTNNEMHYGLSEVSCIFTDNLDLLGSFNKNVYNTVKASMDNEQSYNNFMQSYLRLREIESQI